MLPHRTERERIAVCFAGHPRTFHIPSIHKNLLDHIVEPLRARYDTDVFFLLRADEMDNRDQKSAQERENATLAATYLFDPAEVRILRHKSEMERESQWMAGEISDMMVPPRNCHKRIIGRFPHTLYLAKQCLIMIESQERVRRERYSWVYRMRPDTVLFDKVTMPYDMAADMAYTNQADPKRTAQTAMWWMHHHNVSFAGYGPIADQMTFSSRAVAEVLLRAYHVVQDCELYEDTAGKAPENILRYWMMKSNLKYKAIPFAWATVADREGPQCAELFYQYGPGSNWKKSLEKCLNFSMGLKDHFPRLVNVSEELSRLTNLTRSPNEVIIL